MGEFAAALPGRSQVNGLLEAPSTCWMKQKRIRQGIKEGK